jgi:uncharacterized metal-binding protein
MTNECCTLISPVMLLSCAGASNVGQIANRVAVDLTVEGMGRLFCLAGIGGGISGMIQSAIDCPQILAIDGCPVGCTRKNLERAGINHFRHLVLTDLGMEKNKDLGLTDDQVQTAKKAARDLLVALHAGPV